MCHLAIIFVPFGGWRPWRAVVAPISTLTKTVCGIKADKPFEPWQLLAADGGPCATSGLNMNFSVGTMIYQPERTYALHQRNSTQCRRGPHVTVRPSVPDVRDVGEQVCDRAGQRLAAARDAGDVQGPDASWDGLHTEVHAVRVSPSPFAGCSLPKRMASVAKSLAWWLEGGRDVEISRPVGLPGGAAQHVRHVAAQPSGHCLLN